MRLKKLVNFYNVIRDEDQDEEMKEDDEDSGIYPNYLPILDEFDRMIIWKSSGSSKIPEPRKGFDEEFDRVNQSVDQIKKRMQQYVKDVQIELGCPDVQLIQVQVGDNRFQLEIPEQFKPNQDEYILTKSLKGRKRYATQPL